VSDEGTIRIGGETKHYKLTKPLPRSEPDAAMVLFEGMLEIEGKSALPDLIQRFNKPGGWTESFIYIDGKISGSVKRDHLPRDFTHEGTFQVNGQLHSYAITETVRRDDEVQFKRDELEALAMMAAM
jgi:hypothetical protein